MILSTELLKYIISIHQLQTLELKTKTPIMVWPFPWQSFCLMVDLRQGFTMQPRLALKLPWRQRLAWDSHKSVSLCLSRLGLMLCTTTPISLHWAIYLKFFLFLFFFKWGKTSFIPFIFHHLLLNLHQRPRMWTQLSW